MRDDTQQGRGGATVFTLEQLATQEGDSFEVSTRKEVFEAGQAYHVHINGVECKQTKNGYLQAELSLEFSANGNSAGRIWVMLPVFTKKVATTLGNEALRNKKQVFGKNFLNLLRAADVQKYSAYARIDKSSRSWKFYDFEENLLSNAVKKQREKAMSASTIAAATHIAQGNVDKSGLVGKDVWLVVTESPSKDPKRPEPSRWNNFFPEQPEKYPAANVEEVPF